MKEKNMTHNQQKEHQIETDPEMIQVLKLIDKNFKAAIIKMPKGNQKRWS